MSVSMVNEVICPGRSSSFVVIMLPMPPSGSNGQLMSFCISPMSL